MALLPLCGCTETAPPIRTTWGVSNSQKWELKHQGRCLPTPCEWQVPPHSAGHNLHILNFIHQVPLLNIPTCTAFVGLTGWQVVLKALYLSSAEQDQLRFSTYFSQETSRSPQHHTDCIIGPHCGSQYLEIHQFINTCDSEKWAVGGIIKPERPDADTWRYP